MLMPDSGLTEKNSQIFNT